MRIILAGAMLCASMGAAAAQMPNVLQNPLSMGAAIICDTSEQAKRYVTLRNSGTETVAALQLVNTEANKDSACGAAIVAFRRDADVGSERIKGERVDLVKITVVAFNTGAGWSPVPATVQYAIITPPGIEA